MRKLVLLLLLPFGAMAETAYVTDTLRLGLHQASDTSDRPFQNLESGQEMEVLSRTQYYAHVQLPDGTRGYVKAGFLVDEKPAKLIVTETQAEVDRLSAELEETRQAFAAPAATIDSLRGQVADLQASLETSEATAARLGEENNELRESQAQNRILVPLKWVGGVAAACLVAGLMIGLWWTDHRSRKRHGGIRIY
ncbi:MAG: TIGR04211 family SH3 domain-containing protein [Woeseiaceae bacterium]|nr:TIGR04211 family SH3 domain-containing protein [Woeseiaceae bacterium]NIP20514.1 TIGR04211 family SH3 domain-containing protein [Woeseiaceae bacterium]NIS89109.1 TIGR04211 family SH3 domain-containing protein [Woeseiaceae bacterium]